MATPPSPRHPGRRARAATAAALAVCALASSVGEAAAQAGPAVGAPTATEPSGRSLAEFVEAYLAARPASRLAELSAQRTEDAVARANAWSPVELALDVWNAPLSGGQAGRPTMTMAFARQTFPMRGVRRARRAEIEAEVEAERLAGRAVRVELALEAAALHARLAALPGLRAALEDADGALARAEQALSVRAATDPTWAMALAELATQRAELAPERAALAAEDAALAALVARRLGDAEGPGVAAVRAVEGGPSDDAVRAAAARVPAVRAALQRVQAQRQTGARMRLESQRAEVTGGLGAFYDHETGVGLGASAMVRLPTPRAAARAIRSLAALEVEAATLEAEAEAELAVRELESMLLERAVLGAELAAMRQDVVPARVAAVELARRLASTTPDARTALAEAEAGLARTTLELARLHADWLALEERLAALVLVAEGTP